MNQFGSPWTDDRFAQFKELAATQQYSGSQLAAMLGGGLTRMAVIGKARREGIALRPHNSKQLAIGPHKPRVPRKPRAPRAADGRFTDGKKTARFLDDLPPDESPFACTIIELESNMCRYPLGDPQDKGFRYCGAPDCEGSYCGRHYKLAYYKPHTITPEDRLLRRRHAIRAGNSTRGALVNLDMMQSDEVPAA